MSLTVAFMGIVALALVYFFIRGKGSAPDQRPATAKPAKARSTSAFHAVSIEYSSSACSAAKSLDGERFLSNAAPRIPLPDCDVLDCKCRFTHYADRRAASKHAYFSFLVTGAQRSRELQREFIADLEAAPPAVIVVFHHPTSLLVQPGADRRVFEWIPTFVAGRYRMIGVADQIDPHPTNYVWDEAARSYQVRSRHFAQVFERMGSR